MDAIPLLLLIDKPKGISSFTVIRELRRRTGIEKMGHAGTLDPLATGLMLIGVEKGTKALAGLIGLDKEYVAEVLIGESRSTGDLDGEITAAKNYQGDISEEDLKRAMDSLVGELLLPVSVYSAIKKNGKQMYKHAIAARRKGQQPPTAPMRLMKVYKAELLNKKLIKNSGEDRLLVTIRFEVGSGTYIRSLGEELGKRLGYPATLYNLRRTKVGEYRVEDAKKVSDFGTFLGEVKYRTKRSLRRLMRRLK